MPRAHIVDWACAICHVLIEVHEAERPDHVWMDPEDHDHLHQPPNDDPVNCDTCQSLAEAQWEARFD